MPSTTSPSEIATTIQAMYEIIPGNAGVVDGIGQTLSSPNESQALIIIINSAQLTASVIAVGAAVGLVGVPLAVGSTAVAVTLTITKNLIDTSGHPVAGASGLNLGDIITVLGNVATVAGAGHPAGSIAALSWAAVGGTFTTAGLVENGVPGGLRSVIDAVSSFFRNALTPPRSRDPLAIDLDGDGIETVGIGATPILFDHNADGIRTGTGWVKADDAWLVLDRDGNGLIDSGRELFGVDTLLSGTPGVDAVYASTGFAALAALNSNGDGVFNSSDAAFTQSALNNEPRPKNTGL